jgi:hypothetical protein
MITGSVPISWAEAVLLANAFSEFVRVIGLDKRDTSGVELGGCERAGARGPPAAGVAVPDTPATTEIGLNRFGSCSCSLVMFLAHGFFPIARRGRYRAAWNWVLAVKFQIA